MLTTLTVMLSVLTGGPPPHTHGNHPHAFNRPPLAGSLVEVLEPSTGLEASSHFGILQLQLEPGTYTVTGHNAPGLQTCSRSTTVRLGRRPVTVHLYCPYGAV
jgi:hypothetical protein